MPRASACSMRAPDARVSRPITNSRGPSTRATARPRASTKSSLRSASALPRTPSVPKRSTTRARELALRVLRCLARLLEAVLAALLLARVTFEQAGLLQDGSRVGVERRECARDAEPDGTCLTADTTTVERCVDVVDLLGLCQAERLLRDDLVREDREVRRERTPVDDDLAGTRPQAHAGDSLLAPSGRLDEGLGHELS